nr:hypothetical protein [Tanacetum cinerariifolium]
MAFTFADTHNMITYLTKSYVSEGFDQIINFLNASAIKYALIVNPNIYVSCIKQFWSSILVKKANDVTRLQALIDRKKVIITKATVREALRLDDAESIDCLPNEEIFTELSRMGLVRNVDSSSKFYMYPRFLQLMIRAQVGNLSSHTTKYSSPALTQKVFANMRRVGNGFYGIKTLLFEGMIVAQQADDGAAGVDVDVVPAATAEPSIPSHTPTTQPPPLSQELSSTSQVIPTPPPSPTDQPSSPPQQQQPLQPTHDAENSMDLLQTLLETCTALTRRVENLEQDKIAQALEIIKLKQMVKRLEKKNKLKVFGLRKLKKVGTTQRIESSDVSLENVETEKDADVQGRPEESQAQIYKIDLEYADKVLSIQDDELEPVELKEVVEVVTTAKLMTEVVTAAVATTLITAATITAAPSAARRRKEHMAGFKMDYFKGMSYDDIRPIFEKYFNSNVAFLVKTKKQMEEEDIRALKRKTESSEEKAVKKQKLDEEIE